MNKRTVMWTIALALAGCLDKSDERGGGDALREDGFALCVEGGEGCADGVRCEDAAGAPTCVAKPEDCGDEALDCDCAAALCGDDLECADTGDGSGIACREDDGPDGPDDPNGPDGPADPDPDDPGIPEGQERPYIEDDICYIDEPPALWPPDMDIPTVEQCVGGLERLVGECEGMTFVYDFFGEGSVTFFLVEGVVRGYQEFTDCNCFCNEIGEGAFGQQWGQVPPAGTCPVRELGEDACERLGEGWIEERGCVDLGPLDQVQGQLEELGCTPEAPLTAGDCADGGTGFIERRADGTETTWLFDRDERHFATRTTTPEASFCCEDGECRAAERRTPGWPDDPGCVFDEPYCREQ